MMMSKALDQLRDGLFRTTLVQPISFEGRGGSVSVMCRQIPGQEKAWVKLVDALLMKAEFKEISVHVCRRYIRKDGRMVFGWFVGVEAKTAAALVDAVQELAPILEDGPTFAKDVPQAPPPAPKKYVSPYQDKTPQHVKDGLAQDGHPMETTAAPRAPEESGPDPEAPPGFNFAMKNLGNGHSEMPLPHVYTKDRNSPQPGSTRGAYGGGKTGFVVPRRGG